MKEVMAIVRFNMMNVTKRSLAAALFDDALADDGGQPGERAGGLLRRVGLADHLAAPHDRGVVADALHLF